MDTAKDPSGRAYSIGAKDENDTQGDQSTSNTKVITHENEDSSFGPAPISSNKFAFLQNQGGPRGILSTYQEVRTEIPEVPSIWLKGDKTLGNAGDDTNSSSGDLTDSPASLDKMDGSGYSRNQSISHPSRQKKSTQVTISEDRTHGSEYERSNRLLRALSKRRTKVHYRLLPEPLAQAALERIIIEPRIELSPAKQTHGISQPIVPSGLIQGVHVASGPSDMEPLLPLAPIAPAEPQESQTNKRAIPAQPHMSEADSGGNMRRKTVSSRSFHLDADALGIPKESAVSMEALRSYISDLQHRANQAYGDLTLKKPMKFQVIYRITRHNGDQQLYFDRPHWIVSENDDKPVLYTDQPLPNLPLYLERHPEVIFIAYRDYDTSLLSPASYVTNMNEATQAADFTSETIEPLTMELKQAIGKFSRQQGQYLGLEHNAGLFDKLRAPYLPVFHSRDAIEVTLDALTDQEHDQFCLLIEYILEEYNHQYKTVDSLLSCGKITNKYIQYLIKPGDLLVEGEHEKARGYMCSSWLARPTSMKMGDHIFWIGAWSWEFNGVFSRKHTNLEIGIEASDHSEKDIENLHIRPLTYVDTDTRDILRSRGQIFWKCRKSRLVSYHEDPNRETHHSGDDRYMIDLKMYRELHRKEFSTSPGRDDMKEGAMEKDKPPGNMFVYLLPLTIKGYNLKRKKWVDLKASRIGEVVWNTEALEGLVLEKKTKRLIQALISNQLEAEKSTDFDQW